MPGQTDNELTIDALNQAIVAINEITFSDLVEVLSSLDFCCPDITVIAQEFSDQTMPEPATIEGPPPGWEDCGFSFGSPEFDDRKCDNAHQILTGLLFFFSEISPIQAFSSLAFTSAVAICTSILASSASGPIGIAIVTAGWTATLVGVVILAGWNADNISTALSNNEDDLLCAMITATSASQAKTEFLDVLSGLTSIELQILDALISLSGAMNNLFYIRDDVPVAPSGQQCPDCGVEDCLNRAGYGTLISDDGSVARLSSLNQDGAWRVSLNLYSDASLAPCDRDFDIELSVVSGSITLSASPHDHYRMWQRGDFPFQSGNASAYSSDSAPISTISCVVYVSLISNTPFTVDISYDWQDC
jgi:hypothetical protein